MSIVFKGENFQSLPKFDLKLEGLTVVYGPSNLGKSALGRAFKGVVRNTINANQVRVGSEGTKVEIVFEGHHVIADRPKGESTSYLVGIGGNPVLAVASSTFPAVTSGSSTEWSPNSLVSKASVSRVRRRVH